VGCFDWVLFVKVSMKRMQIVIEKREYCIQKVMKLGLDVLVT
jgi:hypothetical protein